MTLARYLFLGVCLVAAAPALAGPVAGPIEVFAHSDIPASFPGGAIEGGCMVANQATDVTYVTALLEISIVWPDGRKDRIYGPVSSGVMAPGDAFLTFVFAVVPPDMTPGSGTFVCTARATRVTGDSTHAAYDNPLLAEDTVPIEVLAP